MPLDLLLAALRAQPGRLLLAVTSIALGVGLGVAVHTINASAVAEMNQAARVLSGSADLRVEAGRSGFSVQEFAKVVMHPGVAAASPVLDVDVQVAGSQRLLRVMGIDALRVGWIQPSLLPKPDVDEQLAALQPDALFLNTSAMRIFAVAPGGRLALQTPQGPLNLRIAGTIAADEANAPLAVMDIAALQDAFGATDMLSRIDVRLTAGADTAAIAASLRARLPPGVVLTEPAQASARTEALTRAYRVNLTVLALVALFTGGFLVFSISALSVVRRRSELGLLRVLGVTRRGLTLALTAEGAITGFVGALLGAAGGLVLAHAALRIFAGDLGSGFFAGVDPRTLIDWPALLVFCALGVLAGAAGALLPALEAGARPPAMALKAGDDATLMQHRPPVLFGVTLIGIALLLLALPALNGLPLGGYAAIACLLIGTIGLLPALLEKFTARLRAPARLIPQLAWQQLRGMPGYAVSGLATVIVSFSLVAAMAVMVYSFRASLDHWLAGVLEADVYVRAPGGITARMPDGMPETLAALPGVTRAEPLRYRSLLLKAELAAVTLIARTLDERTLTALTVVARAAGKAPVDMPTVWVSEAMVDLYGTQPGTTMTLPLGGRNVTVFVSGVWRDYARSWGALVMDRREYSQLTGDAAVSDMALSFSHPDQAQAALRAIPKLPDGARMELADSAAIRKLSLGIFDRTFAVTYALEFAALLVGLAGIAAHFAALAFARRREFGMLRHLGFTRGDIGRLLALEGATTGAVGAVAGLVLGFAISLILIYVVNRQSFHWGMELHVPWLALATLSVTLIALAALAARLSGRFAMTRAAVMAVKEEV